MTAPDTASDASESMHSQHLRRERSERDAVHIDLEAPRRGEDFNQVIRRFFVTT
jgi:hypothetical protein